MSIAHDPGRTPLVSVLGPAEGRYFATGYKDVRYGVRAVEISDGVQDRISAVCSAHYPWSWSRGADGAPRTPHLSSVDAIALSILVLERSVGAAALAVYQVARVELRAPQRPHTDLDAVPVSLRMDGDPGRTDLSLDSVAGGLRVRLGLRRCDDAGDRAPVGGSSVYSERFRHTSIASYLESRGTASSVVASHLFEAGPTPSSQSSTGLESAFSPAVTVIDLLVTLGQTTQTAIYLSLPIEQRRGDLWMRSMTIDVDDPPRPLPFAGLSRTTITRDRILDRSGRKVHDIDVESSIEPSVRARARLAYVEPAASALPSSESA